MSGKGCVVGGAESFAVGGAGCGSDDGRDAGGGMGTERTVIALAIRRLRSGGYAACDEEAQPLASWWPPTCCSCVLWTQVNVARLAREGYRPGVHKKVVYF
eukprot:2523869-Pleurochrysis_carterae.AAC.1